MEVRVLGVLCLILVLNGVFSAKISRKDVKPSDEDVYGDLEGTDPDIQKDQDYYTDEDVEPAPEEDTGGLNNDVDAKLVSKPETFVEGIGSVVKLPCQASSTEEPIRVWTKDNTPIFQSTINIQNKRNLRVLANGSLEVTIQGDDDYGKYVCKLAISDTLQPEIVHKIVKETSPKIVAIYANDNKTSVLNVGDLLTLTCQATGYPKPRISWHKNNERLGTEGETLTIQNVRPKHAGSYRCLADNKVGKPAHSHIDVYINHSPIVSVEKYIVNSDHKSDAELVCEVKAYPMPVVNWQKDGKNLANKDSKIQLTREKHNERNILIIKDIEEKDFGEYSCVATNSLGRQIKNVSIVKTPALRMFEKIANDSAKDIILQWRVESKKPIEMHELQFRKKGETSWKTISPEVSEGDNDVYLIKHTLRNLEPGVYETRARSKNSHGWSEYSDIMPFHGVNHGSHHQKAKHAKKEQTELPAPDPTHDIPAQHRSEEITPIGESTAGGSSSIDASIVLVTLTLFATYFQIRQ